MCDVQTLTILFSAPPGTPGAPPILLLAMFALAARYAGAPPPPPLPSPSPLPLSTSAGDNARASNTPNTSQSQSHTPNTPHISDLSSSSSSTPPNPPTPPTMWPAGDEFLDGARALLERDGAYAAARPATVQALLLLGHRELGIGAMAAAWTYVGLAIRMAQDLGMHRAAEGWARGGADLGASSSNNSGGEGGAAEGGGGGGGGGVGGGGGEGGVPVGRLFGAAELSERRRIWWGCVIMDKYVSTYIGRPLMVFAWDFDTGLPDERDAEEREMLWVGGGALGALGADRMGADSMEVGGDKMGGEAEMDVDGDVDVGMDVVECDGGGADSEGAVQVPARVLSCFNASARLGASSLLARDSHTHLRTFVLINSLVIYNIHSGHPRHRRADPVRRAPALEPRARGRRARAPPRAVAPRPARTSARRGVLYYRRIFVVIVLDRGRRRDGYG